MQIWQEGLLRTENQIHNQRNTEDLQGIQRESQQEEQELRVLVKIHQKGMLSRKECELHQCLMAEVLSLRACRWSHHQGLVPEHAILNSIPKRLQWWEEVLANKDWVPSNAATTDQVVICASKSQWNEDHWIVIWTHQDLAWKAEPLHAAEEKENKPRHPSEWRRHHQSKDMWGWNRFWWVIRTGLAGAWVSTQGGKSELSVPTQKRHQG